MVPRRVEETEKIESAACVSSVGNRVPRGVKKTSTRAGVSLNTSRVDNKVLKKSQTSIEDLDSPAATGGDVLEGFTKQRATRLDSEILKNPENPAHPLVKEYSDVVSKHPPSQPPPDREFGTSLTS
ncbi:Pol protein [Phytophthora palmivora]|uniref:Pol protein n=1 Tax=Phytophthora palmivora TaxID=4796 RepID=A0A2P4Y2U9_9STRA|nr:Pol protein [Phytophthora palmivora]